MSVSYVGTDLEAMSFAVRYHRWILDEFRPFLGRRLVEVGAGTGDFSQLLADTRPDLLILVEPSQMVDKLNVRVSSLAKSEQPVVVSSSFRDASNSIRQQKPDSVIYVNVLEHIDDDVAELESVFQCLPPGGRLFIFVPAHPWLYGPFDAAVGHYRRYSRTDLEEKCASTGFKIIKSINFDLFGIAPWWLKYRVFRSNSLGARSVEYYDRFVVPISRAIETRVNVPIGKNVLLIAEKPVESR